MKDLLRPSTALWERVARRIAADTKTAPFSPAPQAIPEPEWEVVTPGISVALLATDEENRRVSMLVRLEPGTDYPPHQHGGLEELYLLEGELTINERLLHPGDYSRAEAGSGDYRVRSETGCMCLLVTSRDDILR